jgi:hypothetical protein
MAERRTKTMILLCGMLISVPLLCHAQEAEKQFDVKMPTTAAAPNLVPEIISTPTPNSVQVKPDKKVPETSWFWRFIGGTAIGAAKYNTEKQSEGRPPVNTFKTWP